MSRNPIDTTPAGGASADHTDLAPSHSPAARFWVLLFALVLLAAGAVVVRDVLIVTESITGAAWLPPVWETLSHLDLRRSWLPLALGFGVAAVVLLGVALKPRYSAYHQLPDVAMVGDDATAQLWLRHVDIARISTEAARKVQGVAQAYTVSTRRKITVTVHPAVPNADTLASTVRQAVSAQFGGAFPDSRIEVRVKQTKAELS